MVFLNFLILWFMFCIVSSILLIFTFFLFELNKYVVCKKYYSEKYDMSYIPKVLICIVLHIPIMPFELLSESSKYFMNLRNVGKYQTSLINKVCMFLYGIIYILSLNCMFFIFLNTFFGFNIWLSVIICMLFQIFFKLEYIFQYFTLNTKIKLMVNCIFWSFYFFIILLLI